MKISSRHKNTNRIKIVASLINDKWYGSINDIMFDAGFTNIQSMTKFYSKFEEYEESLNILGYFRKDDVFINNQQDNLFTSEISISDEGTFKLHICEYIQHNIIYYNFYSKDLEKIINHILKFYSKIQYDIFSSVIITSDKNVQYIIQAKKTGKKLSDDLVRVKSSNIWSYGIEIKDRKNKKGDVVVQFKNEKGGPGDLYQYIDVPITVWRKWIAVESKGHYFWQHIRNNYKYRKLTGDKKGKLPNAIN